MADELRSIGYGTNVSVNPVFIISGIFSGSSYFYYSSDSGSTWNNYVTNFIVRRWSFSYPSFFVSSGTKLIYFLLDNAFQLVNQTTLVDTDPNFLIGVDCVPNNQGVIDCGSNRIIGSAPVSSDGNNFYSISFVNQDTQKFVAVGEIGTDGNLFQTDDAGRNYQKYTLGSSVLFWVDNNEFFTIAVGGDNLIVYQNLLLLPICLLPDCDILLSNMTYKNITQLTLDDQVLGYLSKQPVKILKILKHVHFIDFLQETNKPYLIKKNSFGDNIPDKDIHLSGHHRIIFRDEAAIGTNEEKYVGMQTFKLNNCVKVKYYQDEVTYYHIMLENRGEGLIVNNLPVEDCIEPEIFIKDLDVSS
jgi:hypothetical protein